MRFFFKKKTSAEFCRAKSTWKENLLFFSMTFNCKIIAAVLYFCVCAVKMWDQEEMPCTSLGLERRTKVASEILQADVSWFRHSSFPKVFPKELPSLLKSCHLLLLSSAGDQRPAIPYIELSLWAHAAGWESWCYSSATLMLTVSSGKQQQPSLGNAGVLLQW